MRWRLSRLATAPGAALGGRASERLAAARRCASASPVVRIGVVSALLAVLIAATLAFLAHAAASASGEERLAIVLVAVALVGSAVPILLIGAVAASLDESRKELAARHERLRESERLRAELVSAISHEVQTPLASVLGYARILRSKDHGPEAQRRYLEIIEAQGQRIAELVQELLDRNLAQGLLELEEETFDLAALVREQAEVFVGHSEKHTVELDLADEPLRVVGDAGRLAQVVGNLLANAIKFSPDGGAVQVSCRRERRAVRVSVRDHGIGIPAEHQARVFTKFFRGDALARGISGAGLGLAISREIVEAHGGRIGFTSSIGRGSVFWFEIPLALAAQPSGSHAAA